MKLSQLFRQSRRFKINVFLSAALLTLSGCSGMSGIMSDITGKDVRSWQKYLENDTSMQEMTFYARVGADPKKTGSEQGSAHIKKPFGDIYTTETLGTLYSAGGGKTIILIDLETGKEVNVSDQAQKEKLQNSKKIKLYEFGGGIIESVVYSTKNNSVCQAFVRSNEKIKARSVTNYYLDHLGAKGNFFATVIEADLLGNKGFEIKNLDFKFHVSGKDSADIQKQAQSDEFKQNTIDQDVQKQGRFLLNVVCYSMFAK